MEVNAGAKPLATVGRKEVLSPGLYFLATPIGAARDITLRALDILASADIIAAEDTRSLRHLMDIHGIPLGDRPLLAYHDHNGARMRPRLLRALAEGRSVAYASEAGTPLVADPGFQLGRAATDAGHVVTSAPGPSALLAALTVSGLPSDRFLFAGFPPTAGAQRQKWLADLAGMPATVILYESPKRLQKLLDDLALSFGGNRQAAICRELTKRFEEVTRGNIDDLSRAFRDRAIKGEIVVVIDRAGQAAADPADVDAALREALECHSMKDATDLVSKAFDLPRRQVYQAALKIGRDG
jgi:16S rRNA (cytidine1402-2'-O)-methyltransferase